MSENDDKQPLMSLAEQYLRELITEARSDSNKSAQGGVLDETPEGESAISAIQPVDFRDRIKLFETVTRFLAIKHRIRPEEEDQDGIQLIRDKLHSGAPSGGGSAAEAAPSSPPSTGGSVTPFTPGRRN